MKRSLTIVMLVLLALPLAVVAQDMPTPLPPQDDPLAQPTLDPIDPVDPVDPFDPAEPVDPVQEPGFEQPVAPVTEGELTIGDITGNSSLYYGQQVVVQGNVDEFINARSFLIGGGGLLTNPQLLVLNASGEEFPLDVTQNSEIRITGVVYPHFGDGGWDQVMMNLPQTETTAAQAPLSGYPSFVIQDRFPEHTLLVIYSAQDIAVVSQ